jgi:type III pantothenate kinase
LNRLLVDIGNSRIKWALARGARLGPLRAAGLDEFQRFALWLHGRRRIDAVEAVSVAAAGAAKRLQAELRRNGLPPARFARSTASAAGVTNGYSDPWRLGADRWVAAIGAWHEAGCRRAICSISAGTALTIDVVDARGRHRGGLIAPGPELMVRSLLGHTHGIAVRAAGSVRTRRPTPALPPLAGNTQDAIARGSLCAAAALVDRCVERIAGTLAGPPQVLLTGGAAADIAPLLACRHRLVPDLVLRGLWVLSREADAAT